MRRTEIIRYIILSIQVQYEFRTIEVKGGDTVRDMLMCGFCCYAFVFNNIFNNTKETIMKTITLCFVIMAAVMLCANSVQAGDGNENEVRIMRKFISKVTNLPMSGILVIHSLRNKYVTTYLYDDASGTHVVRVSAPEFSEFTVNVPTNQNGESWLIYKYYINVYTYDYQEYYNGYPVYKVLTRTVDPLMSVTVPGFIEPFYQNGVYITELAARPDYPANIIQFDFQRSGINKTISDLFYTNKMNFHKDIIKGSTGWELGAPQILNFIPGNGMVFRIPIYKVISGTPVTSYIDITSYFSLVLNGVTELGVTASAIDIRIETTLSSYEKTLITGQFPSIFIPLGVTPAAFAATHDEYGYYYTEIKYLGYQFIASENPETLSMKFQAHYQAIR